ncbi:hypothetical protein TYRP_016266 [Tyrophagus putrescentiae]|nr:hypothetical protein TYRP_016266 [Tyrophagus putrescentiae]
MSPVAGAGATSPQVTSHQDIYRMLSTAAVAAGGNGPPIAGPLVPSGYEAANYLTPNELMWLQQTRPELFSAGGAGGGGHHHHHHHLHLSSSSSSSSSSLNNGAVHHRRHKRSPPSSLDDDDHHHRSSLLEEWAQAEAETEAEAGRKRRSRFMKDPKSYHDDDADGDDVVGNVERGKVVYDGEAEEDEEGRHKPEKRQQLKKRLKKAASEKKKNFAKKMTTGTTTKKPLPLPNILGSGNFEVIRGGILDKSSNDEGKYRLKSGESDAGDGASKVISRKKDQPAEGGGGFADYGNGGGGDGGGGDEDEEKTNENDDAEGGGNGGGDGEGAGGDGGNGSSTDGNSGGNTGIPGDTFEPFNFDFFNNEPVLGFQGYDNFEPPASRPEYEKVRY